ncbi:MAG: CCA tRNA nucleotidyltransferase [Planctomycetales bacterium]|nr:CCA tRNA nucleotidyltransferase [Planctomycetales bacterium]
MSDASPREFAAEVVAQLRAAGYEALWAGGCVRDQLLGRTPKDYDVATSARPEQVREIFGKRRTLAIGAAFGVVGVLGPRGTAPLEVATFRTDGDYQDGRRPDSVAFTDAKHDAQRRDFTINGLFYDPVDQQVVDYVEGQLDLAAGVIRAIGDPYQRFAEDKLRLLRAVRFAAEFAFAIEPATLAAIQEMAPEVTVVSAERIGAEMRKILAGQHRSRGVALLRKTGLLAPLLPEIAPRMDYPGQRRAAFARLAMLAIESAPAALALLGLDELDGAAMLALCRRLRFTNKEGQLAAWLVEQLPRLRDESDMPWPDLQRLLIDDNAHVLLEAVTAELGHDHLATFRVRSALAMPPEKLNPPPLVTGDDLRAAGLAPGRHFAHLLYELRNEQLVGRLGSRDEALAAARRWIAEHESE